MSTSVFPTCGALLNRLSQLVQSFKFFFCKSRSFFKTLKCIPIRISASDCFQEEFLRSISMPRTFVLTLTDERNKVMISTDLF